MIVLEEVNVSHPNPLVMGDDVFYCKTKNPDGKLLFAAVTRDVPASVYYKKPDVSLWNEFLVEHRVPEKLPRRRSIMHFPRPRSHSRRVLNQRGDIKNARIHANDQRLRV